LLLLLFGDKGRIVAVPSIVGPSANSTLSHVAVWILPRLANSLSDDTLCGMAWRRRRRSITGLAIKLDSSVYPEAANSSWKAASVGASIVYLFSPLGIISFSLSLLSFQIAAKVLKPPAARRY